MSHDNRESGTAPPELPAILLVDDDKDFLSVFSATLRDWGYAVTTAEDGAEALELIDSEESDEWLALLTDFNMPRMTGGELIRAAHIRGVPFYAVVLFSSVTVRDSEVATFNSGPGSQVPFYFMSKPIQTNVLKAILEEAAKARRTKPDFKS